MNKEVNDLLNKNVALKPELDLDFDFDVSAPGELENDFALGLNQSSDATMVLDVDAYEIEHAKKAVQAEIMQQAKIDAEAKAQAKAEYDAKIAMERQVQAQKNAQRKVETNAEVKAHIADLEYELPEKQDTVCIDDIASLEDIKKLDVSETIKIELKQEFALNNVQIEDKDIDHTKPIIEYKDVTLKYDRKNEIIKGINLTINEGEFVYFIGKSGAGKSSLSKMIYKEVNNTSGTLTVADMNVTKLKKRKVHKLRRKIGVVFQDYKLLSDRTVYENVKFSLDVINYPRRERKAQTLKVLELVGILDFKDKYPDELSGGQQQRVAIARAIVDDPIIIVADEPTGNLDPTNALSIMQLLEKINASGTTIIMATHDVGIVNKFTHRVVSLSEGVVVNDAIGGYTYE